MKKVIIISILFLFLFSCSGKKIELLRTGEFITAEQMETLKTEALSWQSATVGVGGFVEIVAIELYGDSEQQVYIAIEWGNDGNYEKMRLQIPDGAQARIIHAASGAGSGEVMIAYKIATKNSEWIELFYDFAGDMPEKRQWENITEYQPEYIQLLIEMPIEERLFK